MEEEKWQVSWRKSEGPAVADGGRDAPVLTRRRVAQQRNLPLQWWWRKQRKKKKEEAADGGRGSPGEGGRKGAGEEGKKDW